MLLRSWKGRHLISVDPWTAAPAEEYVDVANVTQDDVRQRRLGIQDRGRVQQG